MAGIRQVELVSLVESPCLPGTGLTLRMIASTADAA
jgi:hypothetical protein